MLPIMAADLSEGLRPALTASYIICAGPYQLTRLQNAAGLGPVEGGLAHLVKHLRLLDFMHLPIFSSEFEPMLLTFDPHKKLVDRSSYLKIPGMGVVRQHLRQHFKFGFPASRVLDPTFPERLNAAILSLTPDSPQAATYAWYSVSTPYPVLVSSHEVVYQILDAVYTPLIASQR